VQALELLQGTTGRVIVTGMGKSGHVARKIAATLASTGTPAQFVHPAEASHGDLGMIGRNDAVLALSFSGETDEMADLIAYAARFKIPVISMTGNARSTLAQASTAALVLPQLTEACPLGLAPTTSTTAMLALGDALAVALLERRGFTSADFQVLHPGGKLGKRLQRVSDLMHKGAEIPLCKPATPMSEALLEMTAKRLGCVCVVDDAGKPLGIVTDGDLRRHMSNDLPRRAAREIMTGNPRSIRPQALAAEALALMNEGSPITSLLVIEDGKLAGILHLHDCLRAGVA
jgi:arabinose-5-phosphate isomerase